MRILKSLVLHGCLFSGDFIRECQLLISTSETLVPKPITWLDVGKFVFEMIVWSGKATFASNGNTYLNSEHFSEKLGILTSK